MSVGKLYISLYYGNKRIFCMYCAYVIFKRYPFSPFNI